MHLGPATLKASSLTQSQSLTSNYKYTLTMPASEQHPRTGIGVDETTPLLLSLPTVSPSSHPASVSAPSANTHALNMASSPDLDSKNPMVVDVVDAPRAEGDDALAAPEMVEGPTVSRWEEWVSVPPGRSARLPSTPLDYGWRLCPVPGLIPVLLPLLQRRQRRRAAELLGHAVPVARQRGWPPSCHGRGMCR